MGMVESAYSSLSHSEQSTLSTKIKIVFADLVDSNVVYVYVKNVGKTVIATLDKMDVYFGKYGEAQYIPYNSDSYPTWNYTILTGSTTWGPNETVKITITYSTSLSEGVYIVKVVTPNGIEDEYIFSI